MVFGIRQCLHPMSCFERVPAHKIVLEQEGARAVSSHIPMSDVKWQVGHLQSNVAHIWKMQNWQGNPVRETQWEQWWGLGSVFQRHKLVLLAWVWHYWALAQTTDLPQRNCTRVSSSPSRGFVHTLSSGEMFHFRKQLEMFLTNDIKINRLPAEGSASCSGEAGGGTLVLCSCSSHLCTILVDNRLPWETW